MRDRSWRPQLIAAATAAGVAVVLLVAKALAAPDRDVPIISTLVGLLFFAALIAAIAGVWGYLAARRARGDQS